MTDRYEKIRKALAMGPTPGPWAACRTNSGTFVKSERLAGYFVEVRHCRTAQDVNADAHLIAACDPDTIRALLAERDALAAEVERLREVLKDADNELDWLDEDMDTCDHSVGVCVCSYWNMRRKMKAVLSKENSND